MADAQLYLLRHLIDADRVPQVLSQVTIDLSLLPRGQTTATAGRSGRSARCENHKQPECCGACAFGAPLDLEAHLFEDFGSLSGDPRILAMFG
jgi:hypothetical protein